MKYLLLTLIGVTMMLNSKAQNKVLTMEEAVLGYPLYPKNLHVQWQGDRNVFTYIDGTALTGENAADGTQTVLLTLDELNRILNADLKGWGQYSWKNARTLVIHREGKRYEIDIEKKPSPNYSRSPRERRTSPPTAAASWHTPKTTISTTWTPTATSSL